MSMCHKKDIILDNDEPFWSSSSNENSNSSSTGSWVDEYEEYITKDLKEQYENFEAALYSEVSLEVLPKSMQEEVKIWREYAPHLRIRGTEIKPEERPKDLSEDEFDNGFEELIASHGSFEDSLEKSLCSNNGVKDMIENCAPPINQVSIKTELKDAIVDKLFKHAWPNVLKKVEPVLKSFSKIKEGSTKPMSSFETLEKDLEENQEVDIVPPMEDIMKNQNKEGLPVSIRNGLSRSCSSKSHVRLNSCQRISSERNSAIQKWLQTNKNYSQFIDSALAGHSFSSNLPQRISLTSASSRYLSRRSTISAHAHQQSTLSRSNSRGILGEARKPQNTRSIVLPPIETLAITPREPDKRANSAMVRFTKTLPRIRPNTSKNNRRTVDKENTTLDINTSVRMDERSQTRGSKLDVVKNCSQENRNKWHY